MPMGLGYGYGFPRRTAMFEGGGRMPQRGVMPGLGDGMPSGGVYRPPSGHWMSRRMGLAQNSPVKPAGSMTGAPMRRQALFGGPMPMGQAIDPMGMLDDSRGGGGLNRRSFAPRSSRAYMFGDPTRHGFYGQMG